MTSLGPGIRKRFQYNRKQKNLRKKREDKILEDEIGLQKIQKEQETTQMNRMLGKLASSEENREIIEELRVGAERERESGEGLRANAEQKRENSEKTRRSYEVRRQVAEQDRQYAEETRKASEALRIAAENTRLAAELLREASDEQRRLNKEMRAAVAEFDLATREYWELARKLKRELSGD